VDCPPVVAPLNQSPTTGLPDADRDQVFQQYVDLQGLDDEDELLDLLAHNAQRDDMSSTTLCDDSRLLSTRCQGLRQHVEGFLTLHDILANGRILWPKRPGK